MNWRFSTLKLFPRKKITCERLLSALTIFSGPVASWFQVAYWCLVAYWFQVASWFPVASLFLVAVATSAAFPTISPLIGLNPGTNLLCRNFTVEGLIALQHAWLLAWYYGRTPAEVRIRGFSTNDWFAPP